jgi:hypothetical protein
MTQAQTTDATNVVKLLADTPLVKAALAERDAATTLARRGFIAQIKALERAFEKALPRLEADLTEALALVKQAEAALLAAQKRAAVAAGAKSTASYTYSAARDRLEQQLRASAPLVAPFVREMQIEMDRTRSRFSYIEQHEVINPVTRIFQRRVFNNSASVAERVSAIFKAIEEAERLALELDDQTSIPEKLGALAAALPIVEDPKVS